MGVGSKLGKIISDCGLTQIEVAKRAGIKPQTLNNIITRDSGRADIQMLLKLCRVLGVDISIFADDAVAEFMADHPEARPNIMLSEHEINLIFAYRKNEEMQSAIDRLLGLSDGNKIRVFRAARSENHTSPRFEETSDDEFQRLLDAPAVTDL